MKLGPDEPVSVRAAVRALAETVRERTGGELEYSNYSSPMAGDIFVSTQPWLAKAAWFVREKNGILAVHGSDFEGTAAAVHALTARYAESADGRLIRGKTDYTMVSGPQREDVFSEEMARAETARQGAEDWENELVNERNREPARAYSFPLERVEDALVPGLPKTRFVMPLDGRWKFNWCGKPADRPKGFFRVGFDDSDWFEMNVPACVECHGFGVPIFTNVPYYNLKEPPKTDADYNPVSCYRTNFTLPGDWAGRRIHLRFEGVSSAFNVWVNGRKVGYGEDSMLPSEFDITDAICIPASGALRQAPNTNVLAVEVFRWSDGSYLEDQDRFEFSGIHRSVSVWSEPKESIRDFSVKTHCDGRLEVNCDGASWKLYDADFNEVAVPVKDVCLWSAEHPYLYTLVMTKGEDIRSCKVGFREIALADSGAILVNGRPVKMRGVNWREFSATEGFTVTEAELEEDIRLLKQGNFNCVRTCHNPALPYFYHLCDRYGIYVQSEANVESHGMRYGVKSLAYPASWTKSHVERGTRMVANYRNFPSVFQWSLGNEAGTGPVFEHMRDAMLALDDTRLFINRNDNENFKIHGHGYMTMDQLERVAAWGPFFMSEYAHCMGNSMGNFAEYWEMFYRHDSLQGGCIWDWIDQVVPVKTDRIASDGHRLVYGGYGGDWDEGCHHAAGCVNGLLGPGRKPNAKFAEAAHVQRFLIVSCDDASKGEAMLENRHSFAFADEYEGVWELQADGTRIAAGALEVPHLAPLSRGKLILPQPDIEIPLGAELFYRVAFRLKGNCFWAKRGFEVAHDQLPYRRPSPGRGASGRPKPQTPCVNHQISSDSIVVRQPRTEAVFSKMTGSLALLKMDGKTVLSDEQGICRGPRLTCMRAYRDGDLWMKNGLLAAGMTRIEYHVRPARLVMLDDGGVRIESRVEAEGARGIGFTHDAAYVFRGDGAVTVENVATPKGQLPALMRLGLTCIFDGRLERVDYYGRGPWENYVDRKSACDIALWSTTVTAMFEPYVRPQDCGCRSDVRWMALLDADGDGVLVKASEPMFASALHYGWEELALSRHTSPNAERVFAPLSPRKETVANFDLRQMGLGNAQCGPKPFAGYAFKPKREMWTLTFKPVKANERLSAIAAEVPQTIPAQKPADLHPVGMGYDGG